MHALKLSHGLYFVILNSLVNSRFFLVVFFFFFWQIKISPSFVSEFWLCISLGLDLVSLRSIKDRA